MRSRRRGLILTLIIGLLGWASVKPLAQVTTLQTVSPFDDIGFIEAATLTPAADGFSGGGTITVNGIVMTVPTNTLLQMPAFALTWQEVFKQAPAPYGLASQPTTLADQSGLAMADLPTPLTTYEVHVQGNRVGDQYIVGLMFIAQQSLNSGAGFINFIDYANGEMRVGGTIGSATTGARVRINDPIGKFGMKNSARPNALTDNHDDRFTIDEDNPTVRSETAYPMCLPRVAPGTINLRLDPATGLPALFDPATGLQTLDPLVGVTVPDGTIGDVRCPEDNRPVGSVAGTHQTIFTMEALPFDGSAPLPGHTNPLLMMPFEVGDYIAYNGNLAADAAATPAGTYVSAWGIIANVGVLTAPGTRPVYTAIDVMLLGTGGIPDPLLPQEAAVRTRIEGFTTDPTSFIDIFATDVDACTGTQSLRYYATLGVDNLVKLGRWRWRPNTDLAFLPPSRMLTAISENGVYYDPASFTATQPDGVPGTPSGLLAGFYTAPNFDFITPENLGIGRPKVPANFQDFPFLASGSGPYPAPGAGALGFLGQLAPWPGLVAPVTPSCASGTAVFSPIADAGINQSVALGALVTLDGLNSVDTTQPTRLQLSYSWAQIAGTPVTLTNSFVPTPRFTAPNAPTTLTFTLTVSNGAASSSANVNVVVTANPTPTDTITVATAVFRLRRAQLLVTATTSDPAAVLTVEGFGIMGPGLPIATGVPAPPGDRLYRQIGINPAPETVTIRSSLGGTLTIPVLFR